MGIANAGRHPLLAIGIDAAEPSLVRELMDRGELPTLSGLLGRGSWSRVASPAGIGSGAVWPSFSAAGPPSVHEICSYWAWDPERMGVAPVSLGGLCPAWSAASERGLAVAVVDVPFTRPGSGADVEIVEWGAHDAVLRQTTVRPRELAPLVRSAGGDHPFSRRPLDAWGSVDEEEGRAAVAAQCLDGVQRRGALARRLLPARDLDLLLLVFTEVHRASHLLWHTVDTEGRLAGSPQGALVEIYRAVDRQLGELLAVVGPEAAVVVFSLHGMRASPGVPTTLEPLLRATGHAHVEEGPRSRRGRTVAAARARAPAFVKALYHRLVPASTVARIAGPPDAMPAYDWSRTSAFPLPTDQHGWIRINLAGRERSGIVAAGAYEQVCDELEALLIGLRATDGSKLVSRVLRPAAGSGAPPLRMPDLIVHWADRDDDPVRVAEPAVCRALRATQLSGQHAPDGFVVARGPAELIEGLGTEVPAHELLPLLLDVAQR